MPRHDSVVTRLGEALAAARRGAAAGPPDARTSTDFLDALRARQPALIQPLVKLLARPQLLGARRAAGARRLDRAQLLGAAREHGGGDGRARRHKTNVIPGVAEFEIDGRTLPGQTDDDLLRELRAVLGEDVELEIIKSAPPIVTEPVESPVFDIDQAPGRRARARRAVVVPYMIPGFTDAKYFTRMGARWYGFSPVKIEKGSGIRFADMFHGHDERVPVAGLAWGVEVLDAVVREVSAAS